jgi:hypothetical protein
MTLGTVEPLPVSEEIADESTSTSITSDATKGLRKKTCLHADAATTALPMHGVDGLVCLLIS